MFSIPDAQMCAGGFFYFLDGDSAYTRASSDGHSLLFSAAHFLHDLMPFVTLCTLPQCPWIAVPVENTAV